MTIQTYTASEATLFDLVQTFNAILAPLTSVTIRAAGFEAVDRVRVPGVELTAYVTTETGGYAITTPYQIAIFEDLTVEQANAQVTAFVAANPTYFVGPPYFVRLYVDRHTKRDLAVVFYNTDAMNGLANWIPLGASASLPMLYFASSAAAVAASPFVNGTLITIWPGSPITEAGTYQVTANGGISFPADYTKVNDATNTAAEISVVDAGNYFTGTELEAVTQQIGATLYAPQLVNTVYAGPAAGPSAVPTWRSLVAADIPNLDASKITTGLLDVARGGTGVDGTAAVNGSLLIGTGVAFAIATLTGTANRISVVNGSGSITLDIDAAYAGQASITTLGTIATGVWHGTIVGAGYGGTGVDASGALDGQLLIGNGSGFTLTTLIPGTDISIVNGPGTITINATNGGTVTSVALTMPSIFSVAGTPITTNGTLAVTLTTEVANVVFAGPTSGGAAIPTFRSLVAADIPNLDASKITTGIFPATRGGTGVDGSAAANGSLLIGNGAGFTLATLTGTANRLSISTGAGSITLDIDTAYIGQATITTVGTIGSGTWQGTLVAAQYGGTGVNGAAAANGSLLIGNGSGYSLATLTGTLNRLSVTNGAGSITLNVDTAYAGQATITTLGTIATGVWQGTVVGTTYGGTGINGSTAANGTLLIGNGSGYSLATLTGTANRLSVTNGAGSITLNVDTAYAGQTSITTLGTIATGTWQGTIVGAAYGGTGLDTSAAANGTLLIGNGSGFTLATLTQGSGVTITNGGGSITISATGTGGTVTSVALALPVSIFTVSGSPVTGIGTLTGSFTTQTVNTVFAGPSAGPSAVPTFRALVSDDIPALDASKIATGQLAVARGGTAIDGSTAANGTLLIGNGAGYTLATLSGTANRLSVTNGVGSITLNVDTAYVGQATITTLGTIATGTWQGSIVGTTYGGTGLDGSAAANGKLLIGNGSGYTLATLTGSAGRLSVTNGAGSITLNVDITYIGQTSITQLGTIATGTWQGTIVGTTYGGTGLNCSGAANGTLLIGNGSGFTLATLTAGSGISVTNGGGSITIAAVGGGSGTVTSVDLTMPSIFSVSGNPVTTSGTLAVTLATEVANTVFAGPTTGADATPTFRALVSDDIPNLSAAKITSGTLAIANGGTASATAAAAVDALGGAASTGSGGLVRITNAALVTPNLGTPTALVGTNITGTAAGLTAGTVTTNANLTGPVTSVGNATAVTAAAITNTMLANMATSTLKGRFLSGTGVPADLSVAQVTSILAGTTSTTLVRGNDIRFYKMLAVDVCVTSNLDILATHTTFDSNSILTGDVVLLTAQTDLTENGPYQYSVTTSLLTRVAPWTTGALMSNAIIFFVQCFYNAGVNHGRIFGSEYSSFASNLVIVDTDDLNLYELVQNVTNSQLATVATSTIKGRITAGTGRPEDLTATQARTVLGLATGDSPQLLAVNLGNASDTTITRVSAGVIAVEGATVYTQGGALGTPASGVATNLTGTAAGLTAGTVTTNANLTGVITSVGNTTSIASQTGTGTKFVVDNTPTLITPVLGVATATSINKVAITAPATSATLTIADGATLSAPSNATVSGTHSGTSSGTNTGDQTITLSGAVSGTGTGAIVTTMAALVESSNTLSADYTITAATKSVYIAGGLDDGGFVLTDTGGYWEA